MPRKKIVAGMIPVLTDPKLNKQDYTNPMDIVLFEKEGQPYKVKDLYDDHVLLKDKFNQLIDLLKNKEVK
jgi:hypothetical protein